jgi:hypothetical protein
MIKVTTRCVGVYDIYWPNVPVDIHWYRALYKWVYKSADYAPIDSRKKQQYNMVLSHLNRQYNTTHNLGHFISSRSVVLKAKIIKKYAQLGKNIDLIAEEYNRGGIITTLSAKYDYPPLTLLRAILQYNGVSGASTLYKKHTRELPAHDEEQYQMAIKEDIEAPVYQSQIAAVAKRNEDLVVEYFKSLGISLKSEADLTVEQIHNMGRAILTPDILFLDEVYINGVRVHWIDYKDYIGTQNGFIYKSNCAQALKYCNKWGPGALCYRWSYVSDLIVPNACLLDGSALPVSYTTVN